MPWLWLCCALRVIAFNDRLPLLTAKKTCLLHGARAHVCVGGGSRCFVALLVPSPGISFPTRPCFIVGPFWRVQFHGGAVPC